MNSKGSIIESKSQKEQPKEEIPMTKSQIGTAETNKITAQDGYKKLTTKVIDQNARMVRA